MLLTNHVLSGALIGALCRRPLPASFSEYSAGIDYVPADCDWKSGDHPPEHTFYVWGPNPPDYFTYNAEA